MTLKELRWAATHHGRFDEYPHIRFTDVSDTAWIDILRTSCPWIKYTARGEAAKYIDAAPSLVAPHKINDYLLQHKQYDAVEISRMISEINTRREKYE
jgi:hypothetical protein